jgi:hypothetical protein
MGRTKHGNANAQRNNNVKNQNVMSDELVEFNTNKRQQKGNESNKK